MNFIALNRKFHPSCFIVYIPTLINLKISLYFIELKDKAIDSNNRIDRAAALIEQSRNRLLVKEKESITIPSSEDFKIILAKSITKRVGANTYKDGFKISQITYIFKQNKDEYNLSWNKFFNHLGFSRFMTAEVIIYTFVL